MSIIPHPSEARYDGVATNDVARSGVCMTTVRSREDYVAAAAAALGARGPVRGGREIPLSKAAAALGTTRSRLYRWWETSSDLGATLNVHTATVRRGWRQVVLDEAPRIGLAAAIDLAATECRDDPGLQVRAVVASWPTDTPARRAVASWERRWFDAFAARLGELGYTDEERPWTDAAIAVTAHVEGTLLLSAQLRQPPPTSLGATSERHIRQLVEMTSGDIVPVADAADLESAEGGTGLPDPAVEVVAKLDALLSGPGGTELCQPTRLVDLELLARSLDVHPRRLYAVWPTVHDLNGDIAVHAVRGQRELTERLTMAAISATIGQGHTHFRDLFVSILDAIIQGAAPSLAAEFLACSFAIDDPLITDRVVPELTRWIDSQKVSLLALLQVIGFHLLPDVDPDSYVMAAFGATYGCERIAALHPELVGRTVVMLGEPVPSLPAGVNALFRSMTEPCDHEPRPVDVRHSMAPAVEIGPS